MLRAARLTAEPQSRGGVSACGGLCSPSIHPSNSTSNQAELCSLCNPRYNKSGGGLLEDGFENALKCKLLLMFDRLCLSECGNMLFWTSPFRSNNLALPRSLDWVRRFGPHKVWTTRCTRGVPLWKVKTNFEPEVSPRQDGTQDGGKGREGRAESCSWLPISGTVSQFRPPPNVRTWTWRVSAASQAQTTTL